MPLSWSRCQPSSSVYSVGRLPGRDAPELLLALVGRVVLAVVADPQVDRPDRSQSLNSIDSAHYDGLRAIGCA